MNVFINCPCCHNNIKEVATILVDNIKKPLGQDCIFCLCEMNSLENAVDNKLVSCPKCGNLFHNNCFDEYLKHKKSIETPIINSTNVYNHFVFNPNLLPIRSEVNNLHIGSRLLSNPRSSYILYPTNHIYLIKL